MGLFKEPDEWSWWEDDGNRPDRWARGYQPFGARRDRNDPPISRQRKDKADYVREGETLMVAKGTTPLDYLQAVMEGEEVPSMAQMQGAIAILPYRHKKMPVAVENTGADGAPMKIEAVVRFIKPDAV
jgi:hypothetical protein